MLNFNTALKQAAFGIEQRKLTDVARSFGGTAAARARIETILCALAHGYNAAVASNGSQELTLGLEFVDLDLRGFAFEGAGMALMMLDEIDPRQSYRWKNFLDGPGKPYLALVLVGAGFAFARLPRGHARLQRFLAKSDDQMKWFVVDGYGFHHGFCNPEWAVDRQQRHQFRSAYALRAWDHGLGRSLWFVEGADVDRVIARVRTFEPGRQPDLMIGVGGAAGYGGRSDEEQLARLAANAGPDLSYLQLGVALAAGARWQGGNATAHTAVASKIICGRSDTELARLGIDLYEQSLIDWQKNIPPDPYPNHYERWRTQLRYVVQDMGARG